MAKIILTVLGSGSRGNSLHLEHEGRAILVDAGLSAKQLETRMAEVGAEMVEILGIVLTHEHGDHSAGLKTFVKRRKCPIFASHGTKDALEPHVAMADWRGFEAGSKLEIGCFVVETFPVPHDAREPVQLVVESKNGRIGVLTDVGRSTPHIESMLSGVDALFIEANHDEEMLRASGYPEPLKQRIAGPYGHLSNAASAAILAAIDQSRLQHVVAAHLSQHNNRPELVQEVFGPVIQAKAQMTIASQEEGFDWVVVS